jgi:hypothetical protein
MTAREYYTDGQFADVCGAFHQKPGIDLGRFRRSLEGRGWLYAEGKTERKRLDRPAERVKKLINLRKKASALSKDLTEARNDPYLNRMLDDTALAAHRGAFFAPSNQGAEVAVSVALVQRVIGQLAELDDLLKRAEREATARKTIGGNRADISLYELILSLEELYRDVALSPQNPTGWSADGGADEFLGFLRAALKPLGIDKTDSALRENYRDAVTIIGAGS